MKANLFFIVLLCTTISLSAQYDGHVGINTTTPTATMHVKSNGNTSTTQALKLDSEAGTNLLTINDDGTVSGTAAANLSSGSGGTQKSSSVFSAMMPSPTTGYLSPVGNNFSPSPEVQNSTAFLNVAQTVPLDAVLDQMVLTLRSNTFNFTPQTVIAELYVNGLNTGVYALVFANPLYPGSNYISFLTGGSYPVNRGDVFAFRISGTASAPVFAYVSVRYTER